MKAQKADSLKGRNKRSFKIESKGTLSHTQIAQLLSELENMDEKWVQVPIFWPYA